jgi:choline dehydrogenase-like flavoprotein
MADEYDVIICGAGSGGGYLAGELSSYASILLLDAGPYVGGDPNPGTGSPDRRKFSTQINLGQFFPDNNTTTRGDNMFAYKMFMNQSNPILESVQREARLVGGGSQINVGAWIRPRLVDWDGFVTETGVDGWNKVTFEPHYQKCERIFHVHRNTRDVWNKGSVLYEQAALKLGIPIFETSSNRHQCIFCGHRLNAGMPCKYDSLMSTLVTQIPKALKNGTVLLDNATAVKIIITNGKATGVTYLRNGVLTTATAKKLVVASAGAIGTPALLRSSGVFDLNQNVGQYLRAHPGIPIDAIMPTADYNQDRGYQWNCYHYLMDDNGQPQDAIIHASAGFPANTPWVAAAVGTFGQEYKDLMRKFQNRSGAFIFQLKPAIYGQVAGDVTNPLVIYPIAARNNKLEPKTLADLKNSVRQVAKVYKSLGAWVTYPNGDDTDDLLEANLTQFVTTAGALHPQGTCRAAANAKRGVVDTYGNSFDVGNLMCVDASIIPNHISANPNATVMALANRAFEFIVPNILGKTLAPGDKASAFMNPVQTSKLIEQETIVPQEALQ